MDYLPTIYSCGDAYYLGKVLDAVAAVCGTDGGLAGAAAVGALIGVIIITFQTIIHLKGINIHHLLVCWVIYVLSFGTTTDVAIQSAYSDATVIQKDNVPSGPAWIGVIVSNVGYHLTKKMEQAFGGSEGALVTNGDGSGFNEALYLADRIAVINNGQICEIGTPEDIFNNPTTEFVTKFVCNNNFKYGDEENEQRQVL